MSRIGKLKIKVPSGVEVSLSGQTVNVKGPKGALSMTVHPSIRVEMSDGAIMVTRTLNEKAERSLHGLTRSLLNNMVNGVTKGFEKKLEILGVGYRAQMQGNKLVLTLGFSHPIEYETPDGIKITIDEAKKNILTVSGTDKHRVGQVAADIREFKKTEPYKGKGIRYLGEYVKRKAGKSVAKA